MDFDIIIRNGTVIDGSGGPARQADIAIRDDLILRISANLEGTAHREIDASGQIVTPGFVDVHTHYDGQATWDNHLAPSSILGTTTVVMGNCGVGFAPCRPEDHETLIELMEGVEEIPGTALDEGLPWTWESFPEYLDSLDTRARDIDIAALYPHGPLRVYVMGERALRREPATEDDIAKMKTLLSEGLAAGAVGFSTSRTLVHRSINGELVPTYDAATTELKALGECLSGTRGDVMQLISDWDDLDSEFSILQETSEKTGAKGTFSLIQVDNNPELWSNQLARLDLAEAKGLDIRGQVLSRPVGMMMGLPGSMHPFYHRPTFLSLQELPEAERLARLQDPEIKAKILSEENVNPHVFVKIFNSRPDKMYPLTDPIEYLPEPSQSIAALAEAAGEEAQSYLYDYMIGNEGRNLVFIPAANFTDAIPQLLGHPRTVVALGDGGAHVGTICDTSANIYVLTKWVKERGAFALEQAIHMLTRQPCELYSLEDRGLLEEGRKADINVIDIDRLSLKTPHIVHDLPAGGKRFLQNADGILATIKSGQVIYENGEPTGALPGKLLRNA